ncbi:MAG: nuclear transport factor 2 family protein [Polyangiaceae bacterium]
MSGRGQVELRAALTDIIVHGAYLLDERRFGDWLALTAPGFRYRIEAYSPELRKDMVWLDHNRAGIAALIELLPKHHGDGADWLRQVSVGRLVDDGAERASSTSALSVFRTPRDVGDSHVEGGSSSLFLVGHYHDRFELHTNGWLLSERRVRLQTRQLGVGSHLFP